MLTQGVPPFIGLILVGETYRLAVLAGINQGVITVMFGSTTFLTAFVFYMYLNEVISLVKVLGMLLMVCAGVCLTLGDKSAIDGDAGEMTEDEQVNYRVAAVCVACIPPFMWTTACYYYKKLIVAERFSALDLALDALSI